jgi:polysaccharide chain length determinant protein (PEP-CTERM system associated)
MNPALDHIFDEMRCVWRFRWIALAVACTVAVLGWLIVFALPDRYEAYARVFVDTRTALKPALQGLTVDQNVDAQINYVRQSLLAGPQLLQLAKDTGVLLPSVTDDRRRDAILNAFANRISLNVSNAGTQGDERAVAGTIYNFEYLDSDRTRALNVVDILVNNFVERTLGGKRESSESAQKFLETQIKDYEQRLATAEDRLAAFKKKNVGLMPSEQGGYFVQLQNEVDAEKKSETALAIAISRRDELSKQLHGDAAVSASSPSGTIIGPAGVSSGGGDTLSRIQETQARLDELLLKYTDRHPDVIATRATLEELKQRRLSEMDSLRHGDASAVAASGAGNNPVYQSIQLELNKQDVEIAALRRELAQHQGTVAELRQRLNSAPQVEAEYQSLNRDYDVNKAEYAALLENYQKARLGEKADNAGSVRFEVVLPPTAPYAPVWPRRTLSLGAILLLALAAGAGVAYGLHALRPVVSSARSIGLLTDLPVLGSVGMAFPTSHRAQTRARMWKFAVAASVLLIAFVLALSLNWFGARLNFQPTVTGITAT